MYSQIAHNYNLAQANPFNHAMMLGKSCTGSGITVGSMSSCTVDCASGDSVSCSKLFDTAALGFAQSLLAQDYQKT